MPSERKTATADAVGYINFPSERFRQSPFPHNDVLSQERLDYKFSRNPAPWQRLRSKRTF